MHNFFFCVCAERFFPLVLNKNKRDSSFDRINGGTESQPTSKRAAIASSSSRDITTSSTATAAAPTKSHCTTKPLLTCTFSRHIQIFSRLSLCACVCVSLAMCELVYVSMLLVLLLLLSDVVCFLF